MLKSMTGFGKAICELNNKKITIEIKSLNSKQLDLNTRMPSFYKEKDLLVRNEIAKRLERGKVEFSFYAELIGEESNTNINKPVVVSYYKQLKEIADELNITSSEQLLQTAIRLPDTLKTEKEELDENEWKSIHASIIKAIDDLITFRVQEGEALEKDIIARINTIASHLTEIETFETQRIDNIKGRILKNLEEFVSNKSIDQNRFEQELIFYLEKLDITEEKVRLRNHCSYFIETANTDQPIGKKLGFISQEIGREINTIGSKANDADIQKLVIQMKDELEKVKEQMLNVL